MLYLSWVGDRSHYTNPIVLPVFPQRASKLAINNKIMLAIARTVGQSTTQKYIKPWENKAW